MELKYCSRARKAARDLPKRNEMAKPCTADCQLKCTLKKTADYKTATWKNKIKINLAPNVYNFYNKGLLCHKSVTWQLRLNGHGFSIPGTCTTTDSGHLALVAQDHHPIRN